MVIVLALSVTCVCVCLSPNVCRSSTNFAFFSLHQSCLYTSWKLRTCTSTTVTWTDCDRNCVAREYTLTDNINDLMDGAHTIVVSRRGNMKVIPTLVSGLYYCLTLVGAQTEDQTRMHDLQTDRSRMNVNLLPVRVIWGDVRGQA